MRMMSARSKLERTETRLVTDSAVWPVRELYRWKELVSLCNCAEMAALTLAIARWSASSALSVERHKAVSQRWRGYCGLSAFAVVYQAGSDFTCAPLHAERRQTPSASLTVRFMRMALDLRFERHRQGHLAVVVLGLAPAAILGKTLDQARLHVGRVAVAVLGLEIERFDREGHRKPVVVDVDGHGMCPAPRRSQKPLEHSPGGARHIRGSAPRVNAAYALLILPRSRYDAR